VPTFRARTTGAAPAVGDGVGVADADGEAVAAVPELVPPQAARRSAALATIAAAQPTRVIDAIMDVGTRDGYG